MGQRLRITGFKTPSFSSSEKLKEYTLQLNPTALSISVGDPQFKKKEKDAEGKEIGKKVTAYRQRTLDLTFTIDNTGVIPMKPKVMTSGSASLIDSIKLLEAAAIDNVPSEHRPPFVILQWGAKFKFRGTVSSYKYNFTFFDGFGAPLRAEISMQITDFDQNDKEVWQSPDITKMPVLKDGDTIPKLCEKYYDDKKYYIKLAEFNSLSSIRSVKYGSQIEIPPIK